MANVEELIREAEYAFRNVGPGSTNEKKYTARAKRIATHIVRKYPGSIEAEQARQILARLRSPGELVPAAEATRPDAASQRPAALSPQPVAPSPHATHAAEQQHTSHVRRPPAATPTDPDSWANIREKLVSLNKSQKQVLGVILFFGFILLSAMPFLLLAFIYYALKPQRIRRHISSLLDSLS